jgi:glutathione peroxidase
MKKIIGFLSIGILSVSLWQCSNAQSSTITIKTESMQANSIYDFKVEALNGGEINLADFKGKKILLVNTASKCGYTPQYAELEELHKLHANKIVVIGFPANNFGGQEPGSNEEIHSFCQKNYGVNFLMAAKVSVKGSDIHPLFSWLNEQENPDFTGDIRWNFEKYLIDENGKLINRFRSGTSPMDKKILSLL